MCGGAIRTDSLVSHRTLARWNLGIHEAFARCTANLEQTVVRYRPFLEFLLREQMVDRIVHRSSFPKFLSSYKSDRTRKHVSSPYEVLNTSSTASWLDAASRPAALTASSTPPHREFSIRTVIRLQRFPWIKAVWQHPTRQ